MFTRIVVGDDGTPEGRDAVVLGEAIAAATGAGLTLVHAVAPVLFPIRSYTEGGITTGQEAHQLWADCHRFAPHALTEVVVDSNPARALGRYAQTWHADLVVIGSGRRSLAGRSAVGSTGRSLIQRAPCAIAIAKRGLHEHGAMLSTVTLGYDGSKRADAALQFADEIAAGAGAQLVIRTITPDPASSPGGKLALQLCQAATDRTAANSQAELIVGDPGAHLQEMSDDTDLMVVGSGRWGTIARRVLGGVGETLASDCGASLLITNTVPRHATAAPPKASAASSHS